MPIPVQAQGYYEVQVVQRPFLSPNSNSFVNRLFFLDTAGTPRSHAAVSTSIKTILDSAFNAVHSPGTVALATYISAIVDPTLTAYKIYDLSDASPRIPIVEDASNWTVGSTGWPNEVALVISYRTGPGTINSGSVDPTKRGRMYLGPLANAGASPSGMDDVYPATGLLNAAKGFATYLLSNADMTTQQLAWQQYSMKNDAFDDVDGGFIDKRFDTQRRRGAVSTDRLTF